MYTPKALTTSSSFTGSSTDLAPSLLGIYDTLTTVLDGGSSSKLTSSVKPLIADCDSQTNSNSLNAELSKPPAESYLSKLQSYAKRAELKAAALTESDNLSQTSHTLSNSGSSNSSVRGSLESVASANGTSSKHRNNIRVLSANVQRIITHSDAEAVDAVDIEALQSTPRTTETNVQQQRLYKKTPTAHSNPPKLKFSHLPLSRTTGKLTQTGTDLVDTFNNALKNESDTHRRNGEKANHLRKPPTPAIYPIPGVEDDRTPTNAVPFSFDATNCDRLHSNRKLSLPQRKFEEDCLANESTLDEIVSNMSLEYLSPEDHSSNAIDLVVVAENEKNLAFDVGKTTVDSEDRELVDAINKPLISKYATRTASARPLTYARSKSLAARDFAQKNIEVKKTASTYSRSMLLPDLEPEDSQFSAESLDRLTDIKSKFSPKESRKISGLVLPDIAKLKHRPLSSSSICSTSSSSSSSSGAEHMNCKLNTSYLASVESLADHSENELTETHAGMSVFERACMEIVDSERNYVNDLGEVING